VHSSTYSRKGLLLAHTRRRLPKPKESIEDFWVRKRKEIAERNLKEEIGDWT
jgi:hypothetical protein